MVDVGRGLLHQSLVDLAGGGSGHCPPGNGLGGLASCRRTRRKIEPIIHLEGCRCSGFRVQGPGCRVQGSGFRVQGEAPVDAAGPLQLTSTLVSFTTYDAVVLGRFGLRGATREGALAGVHASSV